MQYINKLNTLTECYDYLMRSFLENCKIGHSWCPSWNCSLSLSVEDRRFERNYILEGLAYCNVENKKERIMKNYWRWVKSSYHKFSDDACIDWIYNTGKVQVISWRTAIVFPTLYADFLAISELPATYPRAVNLRIRRLHIRGYDLPFVLKLYPVDRSDVQEYSQKVLKQFEEELRDPTLCKHGIQKKRLQLYQKYFKHSESV